ncbi:MAG: hypothetical protein PHP98_05240 [Kiritimatiellae bacterium]|nr:hypothetical protein [Kiritimatiellia bacterium]
MTMHLVKHIGATEEGKNNFCANTLRVGDLNGDGAPDMLFARSHFETRAITGLTALTIEGRRLWQWGCPAEACGRIYSDLPVQIYDWDGDGRNEVLLVRQAVYAELHEPKVWHRERAARYEGSATLLILDAATGQQKDTLPLPAPADDCFLFADLTGRGRREDLVVKDRYWNMWGVAHDGRVLWRYQGSTGHFPALADVDGDGCDEVFVGFALIDHNGKVLFQHDAGNQHQDAACAVKTPDGSWHLLFGNGGLHCLTTDGRELWKIPLREAQHVVTGHFRGDSSTQVAALNRGEKLPAGGRAPATLCLFDLEGREIWRRVQPEGSWGAAITSINWFGPGSPQGILMYSRGYGEPAVVYNGEGEVADTLALRPVPPQVAPDWITNIYGPAGYYGLAADIWGDSRDEAVLYGVSGVYIYANSRPLAIPTIYNETIYTGM